MSRSTPKRAALALAAHPDDIEFLMAGTLLLLGQAGYELHYMNLASGSCGTAEHSAAAIRRIRKAEGRTAAKILGARFFSPIADDLEIYYNDKAIRKVASVIRQVRPSILLIPSPHDYMEDHSNTCRLAVTAAFSRGMPNYKTIPPRPAITQPVALYHAMPHGLRDGLRNRILPGIYINTASVLEQKAQALQAHHSQKDWLDRSQGKGAYLEAMHEMSRELGRMSGRFEHAEAWRPHSHLGFCEPGWDPLHEALFPSYHRDPAYFAKLEKGF